jgi:hypothetical protein
MSDQVIRPDGKMEGIKTFSFSNEELEMLRPRQELIDQYRILVNDLNLFMQQYIVTVVIPRFGIDPNQYEINFNVRTNSVTCKRKPPEIIKPDNKVVVPS